MEEGLRQKKEGGKTWEIVNVQHTTVKDDVHSTGVVNRDVEVIQHKTVDRVRWGAVLAGLLAALATLATLTVLGLAVGLTSFSPGQDLSGFGIGASIWAGISALISFLVGGLLAARTAGVRGHDNGILNGAMVWFAAIPLLLNVLGGGIGSILRAAGGVAGGAAQVAGNVAGQVGTDPAAQATAQAAGTAVGAGASATVQALATVVTSPQTIQAVTDAARNAAWGTLLALGLSAAAAILGGYLGARRQFPEQQTVVRTEHHTG